MAELDNFALKKEEASTSPNSDELKMDVSPVVEKEGAKVAYVSFSDSKRSAEGIIPDCVITKNQGFTNDEVKDLEAYMQGNLAMLKRMAANVNILDAFMGRRSPAQSEDK